MAGFDFIGLRVRPVTATERPYDLQPGSPMLHETLSRMRDTGVTVRDIEFLLLDGSDQREPWLRMMDAGQALGATSLTVAGADPDTARLADTLARMTEDGRGFGIVPTLEPISYQAVSSIPGRGAARTPGRLPDRGGRACTSTVSAAPSNRCAAKADLVPLLQLCDGPAQRPASRDGLVTESRAERGVPGEGEFDLAALVAAFPAETPVSVETPSDRRVAQLGELGWARILKTGADAVLPGSRQPPERQEANERKSLESTTAELTAGVRVPLIGLGTWPMVGEEAADAVQRAIGNGYRHIDTAENYGNEDAVGEGIRRSGIAREDVFITTKFNTVAQPERRPRRLRRLRRGWADYLDLFLVHWPNPAQGRFVEACEGLQQLADDGAIRAWGVSNFKPAHLRQVLAAGLTVPVNQVQVDPAHGQPEQLAFHREHGITTGAYSPLGRNGDFLSTRPSPDLHRNSAGRRARSCSAGTCSRAASPRRNPPATPGSGRTLTSSASNWRQPRWRPSAHWRPAPRRASIALDTNTTATEKEPNETP